MLEANACVRYCRRGTPRHVVCLWSWLTVSVPGASLMSQSNVCVCVTLLPTMARVRAHIMAVQPVSAAHCMRREEQSMRVAVAE